MAVLRGFVLGLLVVAAGSAAPRAHSVAFGPWRPVAIAQEGGKPRPARVRELLVDGRAHDFTTGVPHDITDHVFVVRRAYRLNDSLPDDTKKPQWAWRLGGWISVDRLTGHVAQLNLPFFDPDVSAVSWYRDYAAYCGTSDDGAKAYFMIAELGRRKPILKKEFSGSPCEAPEWQRNPSRVTFVVGDAETSFVVHARNAEVQTDTGEEEGPQ